MVEAYEPQSNYVIQVTDPGDSSKILGYAFVEDIRYLAADDSSAEGQAVLAGLATMFGPGNRIPKMKAVALPGQKRASQAFYAEIGSGRPGFR